MAGFLQGLLALGSGTCMIATLLYLKMNPASAAATSGYQVLFIGLAAMT
jgi:uncharacterized membrane protein YfcA